jgi:glyceraldehyde 3-phosphate dehydrogenase
VDLVVTVEKAGVTVSDVNDALKTASKKLMPGILDFIEAPLVSIDFNGSSFSSIVDGSVTYVVDNMVKVLAWYDNEAGYAHRMIDLAAMIGTKL